MAYLVILAFGISAFIIVFLYQQIVTHPMALWERLSFFLILTGIIVTSAYIRLQYIESDSLEAKVLRPIASPIERGVEIVENAGASKKLEAVILPEIEGKEGTYSVVIRNLKTGEYYNLNEKEKYTAASLYKLWTMATVHQQIKDGKITMDKTVSLDIKTLNTAFDLGEDAEQTEGTITTTIKDALEQMITISHNYSALLLTYVIKNSSVKQFLLNYHLTDSKTGSPPITTANDIADYYDLLYKGALISKEASEEMLSVLKRQKLNDRIPKYLPEKTIIAHKTGELFGAKHDAGIVYAPKGDYIIVLMSQTKNETTAAGIEANISKAVFEYFSN